MKLFGSMPPWLAALIVTAIKDFVPPALVKEAFASLKAEIFKAAEAQAAKTATTWDDMAVAKLEEILNQCNPDNQVLCDLITQGETALIAMMRNAVAAMPNPEIYNAVLDIVEAALKA